MVEWSKFVASGSIPSDGEQYKAAIEAMSDFKNTLSNIMASPPSGSTFTFSSSFDNTAEGIHASNLEQPKPININEEYVRRISEIRALALRIENPSRGELVSAIQDTYMSYKDTGILTKEEMMFLNRAYKFLTFEIKYHKDKETTIGRIHEILGGLNGQ